MWIWFVVVVGSIPVLILVIYNLAEGFGFFIWPLLFAEFLLLAAVFVLRQAFGGSDEVDSPSAWFARWRSDAEPRVPAYREPAGPRPSELPQRAAHRPSAAARPTAGAAPAAMPSSPPTSDGVDRSGEPSRGAPPVSWPARSADRREPARGRTARPAPQPAAPLFRGAQRFRPTEAESAEPPAGQPSAEAIHSAPTVDGGESQAEDERSSVPVAQLFRGTQRFRETETPPKRKRPSPPPTSPWGSGSQLFRGSQRFRETPPRPERERSD
jgi:hypothetical protein